jgi:hypothetical protein
MKIGKILFAAVFALPLLLAGTFPTNGPPQSGFDSAGAGHPFYVDSTGNLHVTTQGTGLPDAGNPQVPADLANTQVNRDFVLCGPTTTSLPSSNLIGRKWLTMTNGGSATIYFDNVNPVGYPGGTGGSVYIGAYPLLSGQTITLPVGSNIQFYCATAVAQPLPDAGVQTGVSTLEGM